MNLHINYGSCSSKAKMSFLMFSNSSYYALKLAGRNWNIYILTIEENLSMLLLKAFAKRETLLLLSGTIHI